MVGHATSGVQGITTGDLVSLVDASRMEWLGVVETPDGRAGITLGNVGIPAHVLFAAGSPSVERNARASEGSFDSQRLFADMGVSFTSYSQKAGNPGVGLLGAIPSTDQLGGDRDQALAADGHAIEPQEDSSLTQIERASFSQAIVNERATVHAPVGEHGALVRDSSISDIPNDDGGGDFPTPARI